jgi:hypothetical protein
MNLLGNILIGIGFTLVLVGLIFWYLNWPDMFQGRISGFVLIGLGLLMRFFRRKKNGKLT